MFKNKPKIVVILGPTASGKTRVGVRLAQKFNGEIVSADSRQVYVGMDVGTGKDLKEYRVQSPQSKVQRIKYHLIDVASPKKDFNVAEYQKLAYRAIEDILKRGKTPIIVGGTGLYIDAVVQGFQFPIFNFKFSTRFAGASARRVFNLRKRLNKLSLKQLLARLKKVDLKTYKIIDQQNRRRVQRALEIYYETGRSKSEVLAKHKPPYKFLKIGINYPREVIVERISLRLKERLEKEDMIGEVKRLHRQGLSWKRLESFGLEYKWLAWYLQKKVGYEEMEEGIKKESVNFTKRQMTWFKRDKEIVWLNSYSKAEKAARKFLR